MNVDSKYEKSVTITLSWQEALMVSDYFMYLDGNEGEPPAECIDLFNNMHGEIFAALQDTGPLIDNHDCVPSDGAD